MSPVARPKRAALARSTLDLDGRLAERIEHRQIGDAGHLGHHRLYLRGRVFQGLQIVAEQLDGILAFDAGRGLFDIVFDVLGKIEIHAGEPV